MQRTSIFSILATAVVVGLTAHAAFGVDDTTRQCLTDAKADYKAKKAALQEAFNVDKDVCRNLNHECADGCRTLRETCVAGPEGAVTACTDVCKTTVTAEKDECKQTTADDSPEREQCVDAAQVKAFVCRDDCRDSADRAALRQCKQDFKSCLQGCSTAAN